MSYRFAKFAECAGGAGGCAEERGSRALQRVPASVEEQSATRANVSASSSGRLRVQPKGEGGDARDYQN